MGVTSLSSRRQAPDRPAGTQSVVGIGQALQGKFDLCGTGLQLRNLTAQSDQFISEFVFGQGKSPLGLAYGQADAEGLSFRAMCQHLTLRFFDTDAKALQVSCRKAFEQSPMGH